MTPLIINPTGSRWTPGPCGVAPGARVVPGQDEAVIVEREHAALGKDFGDGLGLDRGMERNLVEEEAPPGHL